MRLYVCGYDSDDRELWLIPEVKAFLMELDRQFPFFFWFLDPNGGSLLLLSASCCDGARTTTLESGKPSVWYPAPNS